MSSIRVSYQNVTADDPQAPVETDGFSVNPGEALVLIYIRQPDGTIELQRSQTYDKTDLSSHNDDLRVEGGHVMAAIEAANQG